MKKNKKQSKKKEVVEGEIVIKETLAPNQYIQPWGNVAISQLSFFFHINGLMGIIAVYLAGIIDNQVDKYLLTIMMFSSISGIILNMLAIGNHRKSLWNLMTDKKDEFVSNRDNSLRSGIMILTVVSFVSFGLLLFNLLFWKLAFGAN